MEDGICYGRRHADKRDLAEPLHAKGIDVRIDLVDEQHVQVRNVEVHRQQVFCHVRVDGAPIARVE